MSEEQLVHWAATVTGDEILAAGRFFPRGTSGGSLAAVMGAATGEGSANAYLSPAAETEGAAGEHGSRGYLLVAVSPTKAYVLHTSLESPEGASSFTTLHIFDRDHLTVTFHSHFASRHLDLADPRSDDRLSLENSKHTEDGHAKEVVHALTD